MTREEKQHQSYFSLPHILVVDDDARICDLVCRYLLDHGFVVMAASSAAQARALMEKAKFDAAVVDVMMPGETGLEFVESLRGQSAMPVLLLTALGEVDDRIAGLEAGADDYLGKPFEPQELVLRLKALLRRTMVAVVEDSVLLMGGVQFDVAARLLTDGAGQMVSLTDGERDLLVALSQKIGQVFSRDDLAAACGVSSARAIDVQVTRLRQKIEADSRNPRYLQTVRGQGYLLRADEVR